MRSFQTPGKWFLTRQAVYALRNIEARSHNHCYRGKAISITYTECVCVCTFSYPACNARALCCHLWPVRPYSIFPHFLIIGTFFKNTLLNIKCVFWFSLQFLSDIFLVLRRIELDMIINVLRGFFFSPDFDATRIFSTYFRKMVTSNFMKILPMWAMLFRADRWTDGRTGRY
jgi:hypothetical protein